MTEEKKDKELEKFIEKFKKDVVRLSGIAPLMANQGIREKVGVFYNAYHSFLLSKYTKYLFFATLILAVSATLQTVTVMYGPQYAQSVISQITKTIVEIGSMMIIFVIVVNLVWDTVSWLIAEIRK